MIQQLKDFGFPETVVQPNASWQSKQDFKMQQIGEMKMTIDYISVSYTHLTLPTILLV